MRPTIEPISPSWSISLIRAVLANLPSRRIVTRSPISNISSRWCETYMIAWPSSRSWWMRASSAFVSLSDSAVVGSSKISTRGLEPSTLAISTSWRTASEVSPTGVPGSSQSRPTRSSIVRAARLSSPRPRDAAAGGQAAHHQVLADRQVRQQAELLVDDADARVARLRRARVAHVAALDPVLALVALDGAGEDLDQRALAGAVLAGEAVDLAGAQLERDVLERLDRAVALGDAGQGDDHLAFLCGPLGTGVRGGAHHCAFVVGGVRSCLTSAVAMFFLSASTAPGSSRRGGTLSTVAIAASTTPW